MRLATNIKRHQQRSAFTLVELLLVVAILAILAAAIIPRFISVQDRAQAGVAASTSADVIRMVETYRTMHGSYADGWDTLIEASGGTPGTALYSNLSPELMQLLAAPTVITADQANSMRVAGINHISYHADDFAGSPSDSGIVSTHFFPHGGGAPTVSVVQLNVVSPSAYGAGDGSAAYNILADQFNLPSYFSGGTDTSFVANHDFLTFGLGPKNWMVSETMNAAPTMDVHDVGRYYSRAIAIFAVPKVGVEDAKFIGVIGPDGKSAQGYLNKYYEQAPRDH